MTHSSTYLNVQLSNKKNLRLQLMANMWDRVLWLLTWLCRILAVWLWSPGDILPFLRSNIHLIMQLNNTAEKCHQMAVRQQTGRRRGYRVTLEVNTIFRPSPKILGQQMTQRRSHCSAWVKLNKSEKWRCLLGWHTCNTLTKSLK